MAYCPKCKAEYKEGYTMCYDCAVELVDELLPSEEIDRQRESIGKVKPQPNLSDETPLITINNEIKYIYITSVLEQENIPFRVMAEGVGQYLTIYFGSSFMGKTIYVDKKDFNQAVQIVKSFESRVVLDEDE